MSVTIDPAAVSVACRLCQDPRFTVVSTETEQDQLYHIVRCRACSLLYVREAYAVVSPDYTALIDDDIDADLLWLQGRHKEPAFRQCLKLVQRFRPVRAAPPLPKLLDVGCGTGQWLGFAQDHYDCYGFDASASQARYAARRFPQVRCATQFAEFCSQLPTPPGQFDLITLWDVLEHIRTPVPFLSDLAPALRPQGLLFVSVPAATPMLWKDFLHRRFGWLRHRFRWLPHEHVVYYTPATLRLLLQRCGLEVLQIGATAIYPRRLSTFEVVRRCYFRLTTFLPQLAPQLYALGTVPGGRK